MRPFCPLAIAFLGLTVIAPAARADEPTFTSVWDTRDTSTGSSGTHEITLPLLLDEGTYDFTVDWGDGTTEQVADPTSPVSHTYEESGEQTVSITGTIDGWAFDGGGDRLKLHRVSSWGHSRWATAVAISAGRPISPSPRSTHPI